MKASFISGINSRATEKGMGLIQAIVVITMLTSLIFVMTRFIWTNSHRNALEAEEGKAFYLAESGIEYAVKRSIELDDWNWSQNSSYAGGLISVSVTPANNNEIMITSRAEMDNTAKSNTLFLNVLQLSAYSVYVSGSLSGNLEYDSPDHLQFNASPLPVMDLDSLRQVSKDQGNYYKKDLTLNNSFDNSGFWSNPYNHEQDANVFFVERDLNITKNNGPLGGIFVVMGDISLLWSATIDGIFFLANTSSRSTVSTQPFLTFRTINGGIIGNSDIYIPASWLGSRLSVYYERDYLEKFYSYSPAGASIIEKIYWTVNY